MALRVVDQFHLNGVERYPGDTLSGDDEKLLREEHSHNLSKCVRIAEEAPAVAPAPAAPSAPAAAKAPAPSKPQSDE